MRLNDLHTLTNEQKKLADSSVRTLTERNIMEFSRALDVKRRHFASITGRDILNVILHKEYIGLRPESFGYRDCFEKLLITFAIGGFTPTLSGARKADGTAMQDVVDLCYFMACNGYAIKCNKPLDSEVISKFTSLDIGMERVSHYTMQKIFECSYDTGIVFKKVPAENTELPTAELSQEFISYLENLGNADFIIKELCNLQKFSPDVFDDLAHAWLCLQGGK